MRSWQAPVALVGVTLITAGAAACARERAGGPPARQSMAGAAPATMVPATLAPQASAELKALGYAAPAAPRAPGVAGAPALATMTAALKLIRTGQVSLEVASYEKAAEALARLAEAHGGYVAESQGGRGENDRRHGVVTLKIPSSRFGTALAELRALGKVESEQVGTQDVTKAYSDLETRLHVKRETADRLRDILRTRTARLSDVLEAERELARVTEEIEQMEGERRFYDHQVALSTITAQVHEPQAVVRPGLFTPVKQAFRESLSVLATSLAALVFAVVFLAPWLLVALVAWRVARLVRGRRRPSVVAG